MITKNLQYDHIITKAEPDDANFEPHFHNVYELEYIFNIENGEFAFGHNKYEVKPDTLIVCPPMTIHNMCFLTEQEFERAVIRFNDDFLSDDLSAVLNSADAIYAFGDDDSVKKLFCDLKKSESIFTEEEFKHIAEYYIKIIITSLKYSHAPIKAQEIGTANDVINDVLKYIDDNITQNLNAEIIAKEFLVSTSWLLHKFKEYVNVSLKKYINQKKLIYIERFIKTGVPINKVIESCSYNSYATFFRQYKKYMQKTPIESRGKKK